MPVISHKRLAVEWERPHLHVVSVVFPYRITCRRARYHCAPALAYGIKP